MLVYIVSPLLEFCLLRPVKSRRGLLVMAALCVVAKMVIVACATSISGGGFDAWYHSGLLGANVPWYSYAPFRLPEVALGMLVPYFAAEDFPNLVTAADVLAALVVMFMFIPQTQFMYLCTDMNLQCPVTAWIIWGLCFGPRESLLGQLLSSQVLLHLGQLSYGFYVFQQPVLRMVGLFHPSSNHDKSFMECRYESCIGHQASSDHGNLILALAVLLLLGWMSRHVVDEPSTWLNF